MTSGIVIVCLNVPKPKDLPNEIFICCFEYLNAPDIFYAFEYLNPRFYRLIRTIPLRLNFENIDKIIFDRFCEKMLDYTEIQQQIYSIKLSNDQTHGQIQSFFTYFLLTEFTRLRSLTLIEYHSNNIEQLSSILPLLTQLTCLRLIPSLSEGFHTLISKLPKLSFQQMIPLTKFTVQFPILNDIYQLLPQIPSLQYLNIIRGIQHEPMSSVEINRLHGHVNHLKHLIMSDNILVNTDNLMDIISHMINLQSLTISTCENSDIVNASRWQQLITSSFPYLKIFRFKFSLRDRNEIIQKYNEFQSDFWIKEHQWYTECLLGNSYDFCIFTIPYLNGIRPMNLTYDRIFNIHIDNSKTFDTVTCLHLSNGELKTSSDFYFPNVTSLTIDSLSTIISKVNEQRFIQSLKRIINLSKLNYLKISICIRTRGLTILLEILKEASCLSSLNIQQSAVDIFKMNKELCQYLSKRIKKLQFSHFTQSDPFDKPSFIKSIYRIFPNLEQINYSMLNESESCLCLLQNLSQLSRLTITFYHRERSGSFDEVKKELSKLKNIFFYEQILRERGDLKTMEFGFWVARGDINP
ncbi:hypothetical protein I4U23_022071 [Adineta vaga]|nr:hypothetical protein I4U23_022071 [Adineta vaga]